MWSKLKLMRGNRSSRKSAGQMDQLQSIDFVGDSNGQHTVNPPSTVWEEQQLTSKFGVTLRDAWMLGQDDLLAAIHKYETHAATLKEQLNAAIEEKRLFMTKLSAALNERNKLADEVEVLKEKYQPPRGVVVATKQQKQNEEQSITDNDEISVILSKLATLQTHISARLSHGDNLKSIVVLASNLPKSVDEQIITKHFTRPSLIIEEVRLPLDEFGQVKGHALIEFLTGGDMNDLKEVVKRLAGIPMEGFMLKINFLSEKSLRKKNSSSFNDFMRKQDKQESKKRSKVKKNEKSDSDNDDDDDEEEGTVGQGLSKGQGKKNKGESYTLIPAMEMMREGQNKSSDWKEISNNRLVCEADDEKDSQKKEVTGNKKKILSILASDEGGEESSGGTDWRGGNEGYQVVVEQWKELCGCLDDLRNYLEVRSSCGNDQAVVAAAKIAVIAEMSELRMQIEKEKEDKYSIIMKYTQENMILQSSVFSLESEKCQLAADLTKFTAKIAEMENILRCNERTIVESARIGEERLNQSKQGERLAEDRLAVLKEGLKTAERESAKEAKSWEERARQAHEEIRRLKESTRKEMDDAEKRYEKKLDEIKFMKKISQSNEREGNIDEKERIEKLQGQLQEAERAVNEAISKKEKMMLENEERFAKDEQRERERETLFQMRERETQVKERESLVTEQETRVEERRTQVGERETRVEERETLVEERETKLEERDNLVKERESLAEKKEGQLQKTQLEATFVGNNENDMVEEKEEMQLTEDKEQLIVDLTNKYENQKRLEQDHIRKIEELTVQIERLRFESEESKLQLMNRIETEFQLRSEDISSLRGELAQKEEESEKLRLSLASTSNCVEAAVNETQNEDKLLEIAEEKLRKITASLEETQQLLTREQAESSEEAKKLLEEIVTLKQMREDDSKKLSDLNQQLTGVRNELEYACWQVQDKESKIFEKSQELKQQRDQLEAELSSAAALASELYTAALIATQAESQEKIASIDVLQEKLQLVGEQLEKCKEELIAVNEDRQQKINECQIENEKAEKKVREINEELHGKIEEALKREAHAYSQVGELQRVVVELEKELMETKKISAVSSIATIATALVKQSSSSKEGLTITNSRRDKRALGIVQKELDQLYKEYVLLIFNIQLPPENPQRQALFVFEKKLNRLSEKISDLIDYIEQKSSKERSGLPQYTEKE